MCLQFTQKSVDQVKLQLARDEIREVLNRNSDGKRNEGENQTKRIFDWNALFKVS